MLQATTQKKKPARAGGKAPTLQPHACKMFSTCHVMSCVCVCVCNRLGLASLYAWIGTHWGDPSVYIGKDNKDNAPQKGLGRRIAAQCSANTNRQGAPGAAHDALLRGSTSAMNRPQSPACGLGHYVPCNERNAVQGWGAVLMFVGQHAVCGDANKAITRKRASCWKRPRCWAFT